jgi:YegS/Rv2252/BmrU family lipid kinase
MIRIIFNPKSGRAGRNARLAPLLREFVGSLKDGAELSFTEGPGHATVLAAEAAARGYDRVVSVGGDGTLNETAQGLLHRPVALALVPCGSGNGLARHLHLPLNPVSALQLAGNPDAAIRLIDTGSADGHPFFNVMGLGLDAEVSLLFNRLHQRGFSSYVTTAWQAFCAQQPERCTISDGQRRESSDVFLITVANSEQWGNEAKIAPGAQVDDGKIDLVAVAPLNLATAAAFASRLFLGNVLASSRVRHWRGVRFHIERAAPGLIHTDGETHAAGASLDIAVVPASLRVLVPSFGSRRTAQKPAFALQL